MREVTFAKKAAESAIENYEKYKKLILDYAKNNYSKMFREPGGIISHKFIVPGSSYDKELWDWDSWLTNLALRKVAKPCDIEEYEMGCILNFIEHTEDDGRMPIVISPEKTTPDFKNSGEDNIHKPCLAQHALFVCREQNSFEWLREKFDTIEKYIGYYFENCYHETGLFFWICDNAIGVDNDPCTFYRPNKSSASVYLNCLMYKELEAMAHIAKNLNLAEKEEYYKGKAEELKMAIREHMWDEKNGFYYSVDLNLLPIDLTKKLHRGCPRHWSGVIQKIDVWTGFMTMWANIATKEQAERMVFENYKNEKTFNAPYGVRSLSKLEKMYKIVKSGNPSCWLGPIWGIANYMVFEGLLNYGYFDDAKELAEKTIKLFGQDLDENGDIHEYYDPETGVGVNKIGFQSWNLLAVAMIEFVDKYERG